MGTFYNDLLNQVIIDAQHTQKADLHNINKVMAYHFYPVRFINNPEFSIVPYHEPMYDFM